MVYLRGGGERGAHVYLQAVPVHARLGQAFSHHVRGGVQALRGTAKQILFPGIRLQEIRQTRNTLTEVEIYKVSLSIKVLPTMTNFKA